MSRVFCLPQFHLCGSQGASLCHLIIRPPLRCPAVPINAPIMGAEAAGRVGKEAAAGLQSLLPTLTGPQFPRLYREGGVRSGLWDPALQVSFSGLLCANKPLSGGPPLVLPRSRPRLHDRDPGDHPWEI